MKKVLSIAAIAVFALSFASCKKCATCSYTYGGVTVEGEEFCGKKKEVNEAVATLEALGYTCE